MEQTRQAARGYAGAAHRVQQKYLERMKRTYRILQGFDAFLADEVFNQRREHTRQKTRRPEEAAAVTIQKRFRGYLARKLYTEMLYARYEAQENRAREVEFRRVEEGLLLLESQQLQQQIREKQSLSRQKDLQQNYAATVIQRWYRRWKQLPLPVSAVMVIEGKVEEMRDMEEVVCPAPHSSWAPSYEYHLNLDHLAESSDSDSDTDSDVFARMHYVSRDSVWAVETPLMSSGRIDLETGSEEELNMTSSSGRSQGLKSLNNTGDFSMTQYMRKGEQVWGGPQSLPTLRKELTTARTMTRDELRQLTVSQLRRKAERALLHINQLKDVLSGLTEKREEVVASIEFNRQLVGFLSTLRSSE